jgi:hypothetical protein
LAVELRLRKGGFPLADDGVLLSHPRLALREGGLPLCQHGFPLRYEGFLGGDGRLGEPELLLREIVAGLAHLLLGPGFLPPLPADRLPLEQVFCPVRVPNGLGELRLGEGYLGTGRLDGEARLGELGLRRRKVLACRLDVCHCGGDVRPGGSQVGRRSRYGGTGGGHPDGERLRVDPQERIPPFHRLVVLYEHFDDRSRDAGCDRMDPAFHEGVVRRYVRLAVPPVEHAGRDGHEGGNDEQRHRLPAPGVFRLVREGTVPFLNHRFSP